MDAETTLPIQSFRQCFAVERRIHRLDQWRLPLPYGLPVRGIVYFVAVLAAMFVLVKVPVLGAVLGTLPTPVRLVVLPVGGAWALISLQIDGRASHMVGVAWLRLQLEPRRLVGFRAAPRSELELLGTVTLAPDERSPRLRPGVVSGRGRIVLRYPVDARAGGKRLRVSQQDGEALWVGKQVELQPGQQVVVGT
jgi:hypothetical protein